MSRGRACASPLCLPVARWRVPSPPGLSPVRTLYAHPKLKDCWQRM